MQQRKAASRSCGGGFSLCAPFIGVILIIGCSVMFASDMFITKKDGGMDVPATAQGSLEGRPSSTITQVEDSNPPAAKRQKALDDAAKQAAPPKPVEPAPAPAKEKQPPAAKEQPPTLREQPAASTNSVQVVKLETPVGEIEAKQIGDPSGIPVLMVHGMAKNLVWEWEEAALALAAKGCFVTIPNFHSLEATAPGKNSKKTEQAIEALISKLKKKASDGMVLMGKSWGGGTVLSFALNHPELVSKLVMAAPAGANPKQVSELKVKEALVLWTKDDNSFSKAQGLVDARPGIQHDFQASGGHRIVAAYVPALLKFVLGTGA